MLTKKLDSLKIVNAIMTKSKKVKKLELLKLEI